VDSMEHSVLLSRETSFQHKFTFFAQCGEIGRQSANWSQGCDAHRSIKRRPECKRASVSRLQAI
jgi:hypothetical protein